MKRDCHPVLALTLLIALIHGGFALGQDSCTQSLSWFSSGWGNYINLYTNQSGMAGFISSAANAWNFLCTESQTPRFEVGSGAPSWYDLQVNFFSGSSTSQEGGCGETILAHTGSTIEGGAINIWEQDHLGSACDYVETLTHELGHALGFDNVTYPWCEGRMMYVPAGSPRTLTPTECAAADAWWNTDWESADPCDWPNPPQGCDPGQEGSSPIVVDLDRDGLDLTGLDRPMRFDVDADGFREVMGWISGRGDDAFLWLDHNGNGVVDDGTELFGNHTRLVDGRRADHGFEALAELDSSIFGGNENGSIDPDDEEYWRLRLWIDRNHNGRSSEDEIASLPGAGVVRLDLRYQTVGTTDRNGNLLRYKAPAWIVLKGKLKRSTATDVFFVTE